MTASRGEDVRSYLAAQSAKLSAADIKARLDEAAGDFLACLNGIPEDLARQRPSPDAWSVAEVVEHVRLTLEDVTGLVRMLLSGVRPPRPMTVRAHPSGGETAADGATRLRKAQEALATLLETAADDRNVELRVPDHDFGLINWKGYALILRLHYESHRQQVLRTLAVVQTGGPHGDPRTAAQQQSGDQQARSDGHGDREARDRRPRCPARHDPSA